MEKQKLLIVGDGGHAKSCIDVVECQGLYEIAGIIGAPSQKFSKILGHKVIGFDSELPNLVKTYQNVLIAVGQINSHASREDLYRRLKSFCFSFPRIISPRAYISQHSNVGEGTIVMHGATINSGVRIGNNCIINSHALIEHDSVIGDNCHISTSATLNGNVLVGAGSFIGSGSVIREGIAIGSECFIGMGSLVTGNVEDNAYILNKKNE